MPQRRRARRPQAPRIAAPQEALCEIESLSGQLEVCQSGDRVRFGHRLQRLKREFRAQDLAQLKAQIAQSAALVDARHQAPIRLAYDEALPIAGKRDEIKAAIAAHQVVVIAGETGSGKTTQLPKICLELGRGLYGQIGHTQPRRLAARSVASRIAEELGTELGQGVGYQVRFHDQVSEQSRVKLMTDGILLAEIQQDRFLSRYDTLIIDEAHERSLNIDFLLGYLKLILAKRPDLKLIITSATIDLERFSAHFNDAPIIEVSGRTFPVEVHYRPLLDLDDAGSDDSRMTQGVLAALEDIEALERSGAHPLLGDVLVFLSGEREIRELNKTLKHANLKNTEVLPLYARLSAAEQQRVFRPHKGRRIILSTNVAETSLTVPGIRYVIDPGEARISRYSVRSKVQRLPIEAISQASANQRKGRCGRIADGVCFRLYDEADFLSRPEFTDPEIRRTNLAAVILQMLRMGLGEIRAFPFIDPPEGKAINDGFKLLEELGAVDRRHTITPLGRKLAQLPIDPRLGRMLLAAADQGALSEVLVIASALAIQDPRERPAEKKQASDQRHKERADKESDFVSFLNLWQFYEEQRETLSQTQLRKLCKKEFLSYMRMREWRDMHRQLMLACKGVKLVLNPEPAGYDAIHKSLLAGLLSHLGSRYEEKDADYLGARNRKFHVFPASSLFKKKPRWLMAAELVETARLYARTCARIEPEWIEPLAAHLVKRNYFEPHWEKRRAQVVAFEQVSLYGLIIVARRRVHYGPIDPVLGRELFIRQALVEGAFSSQAPFFRHNQALIEEVDQLEAKSRRRDILVDPETLFAFYQERIPEGIHNGVTFEQWRRQAEAEDPERLFLTRDYLMQHEAEAVTEAQFPDQMRGQGYELGLAYHFEPGHAEDGVSVQVPVSILQQLPRHRFEWLVPGMLEEKCIALVRSLPKAVRKNFVPVPDFVRGALQALNADELPLTEALAHQLLRMTGVRIPADAWAPESLEPHLLMNFQVRDAKGKLLGQGRDLAALKERFSNEAQAGLEAVGDYSLEQEHLTRWSFGDLPEVLEQKKAGLCLKLYPALVDEGDTVSLKLLAEAEAARRATELGLARLFRLQHKQGFDFLVAKLKKFNQTALYAATVMPKKKLLDELLSLAARRCFLAAPWPRSEAEFAQRLEAQKSELIAIGEELDEQLFAIFERYNQAARRLKGKISFDLALMLADIKHQLAQLIRPGFINETAPEQLAQFPRYLAGVLMRLDKMGNNLPRDRMHTEELSGFWQQYQSRLEAHQRHGIFDPKLDEFRWQLEEYRISCFAQTLGTVSAVSDKRLKKLFAEVKSV